MDLSEGFASEFASFDSREPASDLCISLGDLNGYARTVSDFTTVSLIWTTNPATGLPWTAADVDALQAGVEAADVVSSLRVTQVSVTVKVFDGAAYTYSNGATGMDQLTPVNRNGTLTSFTYDANGNLDTKTGGWDYDWNAENLMTVAKLSGAQQQAYIYDGLGRRVKVDGTSSSTWTVSIVAGMDVIYEKDSSGGVTKYVHANGMRIAKITSTGAVHGGARRPLARGVAWGDADRRPTNCHQGFITRLCWNALTMTGG